MKKTVLIAAILFMTVNLFAQKGKVELFETDRFDVPVQFEELDIDKKMFQKVHESPSGDGLIVYISNNELLLDSYYVEGKMFAGGVAIYEMDFVIKLEIKVDQPIDKSESFKDFNYEDGQTKATLFFRDEYGYKEHEIKVADGFIVTKRKSEEEVNYKFALLLNRFYSVKCNMTIEQIENDSFTMN